MRKKRNSIFSPQIDQVVVLAKTGADRAENGQHLAEILSPNQRLVLRGSSWGICHAPTNDFFYVARLGVSATLQPTTCFTWLVLEYLPRSRSRLYRRQFLQVNMRWKAFDEIYKIYMLLHRSDLNILENFRQTFSHISAEIFQNLIIFIEFCSDFNQILSELHRYFRKC